MKNKGITALMLAILTILFCSCGGEYAVKKSTENVVSGSAVSGSAVKGSAIRETAIKEKTKEEKQAESFTTMLYLHNSRNAYRVYAESVSEIQQLTMKGEVIRTIAVPEPCKDDDPLKIAKVTEDELFYVVSKEKGEDTWTEELWSIPLIQENGADTPQVAQAKKIFEAEEDSIDILYADSRYISYGETEYKEYDRKEGKFIEVDCEAEEKDYYCLASTYWGEWHGENNLSRVLRIHDNLCFYDLTISEDDDEIEYEYGCYDFGQKEEIKINQKELEKTSGDWFTRRELPY